MKLIIIICLIGLALTTASFAQVVKAGDVLTYREERIDWNAKGNADFLDQKHGGGKIRVRHEIVEKKETVKSVDRGLKYGFPLKVGKAWGDGVDGVGCSKKQHTYCNYVERQEDVSVPAGIFVNCFKVVYETLPDTSIDWYCPGIGIVKSDYDHHGTITITKSELVKIERN